MSEGSVPETSEPEEKGGALPGDSWFREVRFQYYCVPVLLSALALSQLTMGKVSWLTPWKGGGFGMFSTVDSPSGRVVRVYLETDDGEIPTRLPRWVMRRRDFARSFPTDFRLNGLRDDLAAASWYYVNRKTEGVDESATPVEGEPQSAPASASNEIEADKNNDDADSVADDPNPTDRADESEEAESANPRVSSRKADRSPRDDREAVPVKSVRLEVWRRRYDRDKNRLWIEKIKETPPKAVVR